MGARRPAPAPHGEKTVEVHRGQVMAKMDVESLAELVRVAVLMRVNLGSRLGALVPQPPAPEPLHGASLGADDGVGAHGAGKHDRPGK